MARGAVRPGIARRRVYLQLRGTRGWQTVDRTRTRARGRYRAAWRPPSQGRFALRVRTARRPVAVVSARRRRGVRRRTRGVVNVYRPGHASWYGPGLYGNRTACGRTLTASTLGVAHKSLPCGTRVTFRRGRRSVTVPVVDRGPFAAGREWDLTAATKRRLGFGSTGTVWSTR